MINELQTFITDHFGTTVVSAFLVLSVVVDVSKIKVNPWKWVFRQLMKPILNLRDMLLKDVTQEMVNLVTTMSALSGEVSSMHTRMLENKKSELRRAILRFADECRIHHKHSKEMFENALTDISDYSRIVKLTDDPNHVLISAINMIEKSYEKCLEDNDFL